MDVNTILRRLPVIGGKFSQDLILKYIKFILIAAIAIVLLLLARDAISLWYGGSQDDIPEQQESVRTRLTQKKPLNTYAPVVENNVFGIEGARFKALTGQNSSRGEVPSQLGSLRLLGTVAWSNGFGYAFVAGSSGEQQVYKSGEDVEGAGKLVKVGSRSILIDSSGTEVELALQEIGQESSPAGGAPRNSISSRKNNGRSSTDFARQTSETSYVVNQKAVEESINNPENIMTDARLIPNMVEGKQRGFVIQEVKKPGIYHSLGLQNNDILVSVNEFELSNPQAALQAFSALKGMDYIELSIMRDGDPLTLTYSLR